MTYSETTLNTIVGASLAALFALIVGWLLSARVAAEKKADALKAENALVLGRLTELETKERLHGEAMKPIVSAFHGLLVKQLTHAEKPEMDMLLSRLGPPNILKPKEYERLMTMLEERAADMSPEIDSFERDAATILPAVIKMTAREQANIEEVDGARDFNLMTVVSVVGPRAVSEPRQKDECTP